MAQLARGVSSLFEDTRPRVTADRLTIALLVLIVAVGILVRFWGLGNVGLHGDEKTMALPAMHLLQYGTPEMPSGFTYPRAMAQLYLMAGSALAFGGPSEWTTRWRPYCSRAAVSPRGSGGSRIGSASPTTCCF